MMVLGILTNISFISSLIVCLPLDARSWQPVWAPSVLTHQYSPRSFPASGPVFFWPTEYHQTRRHGETLPLSRHSVKIDDIYIYKQNPTDNGNDISVFFFPWSRISLQTYSSWYNEKYLQSKLIQFSVRLTKCCINSYPRTVFPVRSTHSIHMICDPSLIHTD